MKHEEPVTLFPVVLNYIKETDDHDTKLIEDSNYAKWSLDNAKAASFVLASYDENDNPISANVRFLVRSNGSDVMMNFITPAMDFDLSGMQLIEKRMINSIHFFD